MVALVQPESSRDSGSPQRFIFNTQKNNHLEIAETCADPQITSTQPAARHNQPGQNACAHTRFERKEKGKNKIQHPGIKDWQILSVTTQPRKGREKKVFFGSYCTRRATTECFSSQSRWASGELWCYWGELGEISVHAVEISEEK